MWLSLFSLLGKYGKPIGLFVFLAAFWFFASNHGAKKVQLKWDAANAAQLEAELAAREAAAEVSREVNQALLKSATERDSAFSERDQLRVENDQLRASKPIVETVGTCHYVNPSDFMLDYNRSASPGALSTAAETFTYSVSESDRPIS